MSPRRFRRGRPHATIGAIEKAPLQRKPARLRRRARTEQAPGPGRGPGLLAAGNRAVAALLQRQVVEAPPKLLGGGQAAMAVSFYKGKPDLYPEDVVTKIQHAVKSPETGVPDEDMVEGVAKFQSENFLKVDGMAGPRTLPRLFNSGLATETDRKEFVAVGKDVEQNWATLGTAEERAKALFAGVKIQLDKEKVPTPKMEVGDTGIAAGVFDGKDWKITFGRAPLSAATISDDDARDLSGTVYHEARHAEQQHKMARMLAAKGNTSAQIQAKMGIPDFVADDAVGNKLTDGIEIATASQQFDSEFGAGRAHFIKSEKEAPSAAELRAAQQAVQDNPTAENTAKLARLTAAFKAYHDLPTENDAFATEGDLEATWDELTPTP